MFIKHLNNKDRSYAKWLRALVCFLIAFLSLSESHALGRIGALLKDTVINGETRIVVIGTLPGSPAEKAGFLPNDILLFLDGRQVKSRLEFVNDIRAIRERVPVSIELERSGERMVKKLVVELIKDITIRLKITRPNIFFTVNTSEINVYINNEYLGLIPPLEWKEFVVPATEDNANSVFVTYKKTGNLFYTDTALYISEIVRFKAKDEYTSVVTFEYPDLEYEVTFEPTEKESVRLNKARLDSFELIEYNRIVSDLSLAPKWFKASTKRSLNLVLGDGVREGFWTSIVQATTLLRVLALYFILLPVFGFVNFSRNKGAFKFATVYSNPFYLLLFYPGALLLSMISKLGSFAITGQYYYSPFEFIFFCGVSLLIFGGIIYTIGPLYRIIRHDASIFKKSLGIIGILLEGAGLVFTVLEIFRRAGYPLDGK